MDAENPQQNPVLIRAWTFGFSVPVWPVQSDALSTV